MKYLLQLIGPIPFLALSLFAAGSALGVAVLSFDSLAPVLASQNTALHYLGFGLNLALSYFVYGLSLIIIAPTLNFILQGNLKAWRGPAVSFGALKWYIHCSMTLIVRLSFLEFVTPTPFSELFYRLMGMKIGRNVTLNSTAIADPSLITLEDKVTIGGSASILAHYAQGGYLVVAPVIIREGATIGMRAIVMGGVEVGKKAKVLANSFVLPNTKIPDGETWAGIPAHKIDLRKEIKENVAS